MDALLADLTTSAGLFRSEAAALPEDAWGQPVQVLGGAAFPALQLELAEPMRTQRDDRAAGRPRG